MNEASPGSTRLARMRPVMEAAVKSTLVVLQQSLAAEQAEGVPAELTLVNMVGLWNRQVEAVVKVMREEHPDTVTRVEAREMSKQLAEACLGVASSALAVLVENDSSAEIPRTRNKIN